MSVLRAVRKRKKVRKLGAIDIIRREAYADLELDAKVELIRALVPLGLLHVQELLDQEVTALAGARYARKDESVEGRRHGSNPGTVGLAGQRVPIRVPRIRHIAGSEIPLRSYEVMRGDRDVDDLLLRRVLYGISCRNYEAAADSRGDRVVEFDGVPWLHPPGQEPSSVAPGRESGKHGAERAHRIEPVILDGGHRAEPGPGATVCPSGQARDASSAPTTVRTTTRPSVRSRRSSASWTSGTSRRPAA